MFGASACLVGMNTRYDGGSSLDPTVHKLFLEGKVIPLCPEQLGGLTTPRPRAEILGGSGADVINGKAAVGLEDGTDATLQFVRGAEETLKVARELGITRFYFKCHSPSCGVGKIKVGGALVDGDGVCAALLLREGIELVSI